MVAYEGRRCLKSCPAYHQTTSCSCGQPGDPEYRQKRPNEDLDASEDVYMETQSRVVELREQLRRLRIAHLRRMADVAEIRRSRWSEIAQHGQDNEDRVWCRRNAPRMGKLYRACRVEIARLRGEE